MIYALNGRESWTDSEAIALDKASPLNSASLITAQQNLQAEAMGTARKTIATKIAARALVKAQDDLATEFVFLKGSVADCG